MKDGSADSAHAVALLRSADADSLWASLRADGFLVEVRESGTGLLIDISEGQAACADCLVPGDVIRAIVRGFLDDGGVTTTDLPIDVRLPADAG